MTGPPGTGKTTTLAKYARDAVLARGSDAIVIASLTKAAAAEITSRDIPIQRGNAGTLHSLCFRALGSPELAEKHIGEWNDEQPAFRLSGGTSTLDDPNDAPEQETPGDALREKFELYRHKLVPEVLWPDTVRAFGEAWRAWMKEADVIDFTGLLELAREIVPHAPGEPSVLLGDEVQDWSRLETSLFRDHWGQHAETVILCGDPDQTIFAWRGANSRIFLDDPVPPSNDRLLAQSYRVPRAVHALAQRIVRQIEDRADVAYLPRDEDGAVTQSSATWKRPDQLLRLFEAAASGGPTVMVLATCSYQLAPVLAILRQHAIPFHNPYRRRRGDWNPLASGDKRKTMAADRVLAFLRAEPAAWGEQAREWVPDDLRAWIAPLKAAGLFSHGAKSKLDAPGFEVARDFFDLFEGGIDSAAARAAMNADIAWYRAHLLPAKAKSMALALDVAEKRSPALLREEPRVVVGTIHSVKGGEADTVVLFPDLSVQAAREAYTKEGRDAQYRLAYVAVTRARREVILCRPAGPLRMRVAA